MAVDNLTDAGKADAEVVAGSRPLDPLWPLGLKIEGYTTYTPNRPSPARGPGE